MTAAVSAMNLEPTTRHWLHDPSRTWSETNCYADLWVQLLHRLGVDPVPALAFTVGARFEGEQWSFAKPPPGDLYRLYGIRVLELLVWRPLADHVAEASYRGNLLTIEVDAFWLPDTAGTTYRTGHDKTTIVPVRLDAASQSMRYLHNGGCFDVGADDIEQLFASGTGAQPRLAPYTELVSLEDFRVVDPDLDAVRALVGEHLARRPRSNPVAALAQRVRDDLPWLSTAGVDTFHLYAFATARQCGANATLAAALATWLDDHDDRPGRTAAEDFERVADGAKTVQFLLARAARGRTVDLIAPFTEMAEAWERAIDALVARHGR